MPKKGERMNAQSCLFHIWVSVNHCFVQCCTEGWGRRDEMPCSQRARLKSETSPDWLRILVCNKLPAEFLQKPSAQRSADPLFEGNIKHGIRLGFSSPIEQIKTVNTVSCGEHSHFCRLSSSIHPKSAAQSSPFKQQNVGVTKKKRSGKIVCNELVSDTLTAQCGRKWLFPSLCALSKKNKCDRKWVVYKSLYMFSKTVRHQLLTNTAAWAWRRNI